MKIKRLIAVVGIALAGFIPLLPSMANAQSNGLGITPRKNLTVNPGEKIDDTVTVTNLSKTQPLNLSIKLVDFESQDETGQPKLMLDDKAEPTAWSLKPFLKIQDTVSIEPGKSANIPFSLTIPEKQGAGSYYSSINYASNVDDSQKVTIASSGATLVFVKVPGDAKELLKMEQFGAFTGDKLGDAGAFKSFFTSSTPSRMAYRLKNEGNIAEQPSGSILVKNMFGKQVKLVEDANPRKELALLGQTRRFEICLDEEKDKDDKATGVCKKVSMLPGRYTATISVFYGENGSESREVTAKASFWVLPAWFIILVAIVLAAVVGGIFWVVRKLQNRR